MIVIFCTWIILEQFKHCLWLQKYLNIYFYFLPRCLELQPNNLKALMALAVSYTNTGHQQEAYQALRNWIKQNPKYKYIVRSKKGSPALTRRMSKTADER